jgi:short-subunit dehydrogenase
LDDNAKVVVITGAGSGIGLAAALEYAKRGWKVGLIGRGAEALADASRQVAEAGGVPHVALADVADGVALEAAAAAVEAVLGPIDVWINNAGIGIDVNLHGTVNGTRIALARMKPRDRGTIIQILSAISYRGVPLQSAYSTTKYGLRGFTEALRAELVNDRSAVHVTMVHPPSVNTPFYSHAGSVMDEAPRPPPPVYQPEIIGEAIYMAGTRKRREWRVTGETVGFSIANKIAPGLLDQLSGLAGVAVQHTKRQDVAERRDPNTFTPSTKPSGTHGPFDRESLGASAQWWASKNPGTVGLGLGVLALGVLGLVARRRG